MAKLWLHPVSRATTLMSLFSFARQDIRKQVSFTGPNTLTQTIAFLGGGGWAESRMEWMLVSHFKSP